MNIKLEHRKIVPHKRTLDPKWQIELSQDLACYVEGPDGFPMRVYDSEMERLLTTEIDEKDNSL